MQETLFERNIRWALNEVSVCIKGESWVGAMRGMCCIIDGFSGYFCGSQCDYQRNVKDEYTKFMKKYFTEFKRYASNKNGSLLKIKFKPYRDTPTQIKKRFGNRYRNHLKKIQMKGMDYYEILYSQFRCGLVHTFLMKYPNAIYKGRDKPYFKRTKKFKLLINVEHFYDDFIKAILTYKDEVLTNKDNLKDNYRKRHKFLTGQELRNF